MENASKALLIAGAILLAILLISLGIMVFTQAQSTVETSGMSQAEITAFNNKFLKYEGTKSGTEVKALINEVLTSNSTHTITLKLKNAENADVTHDGGTSQIVNNNEYEIKLGYSAGFVNEITITGEFAE